MQPPEHYKQRGADEGASSVNALLKAALFPKSKRIPLAEDRACVVSAPERQQPCALVGSAEER